MSAAVFIDRDDTLIENGSLPPEAFAGGVRGDFADPDHVRLLPGALEGCERLHAAGYLLVVVSNQGVVARGGATLDAVEATNERLCALLPDPARPGSSLIARVYFCPYHPNGSVEPFNTEHEWRKPAPGMLLAAASDLGIDLGRSWMVGDAERDLESGRRAGIDESRLLRVGPEGGFAGLAEAASHILAGTDVG